MEYIHTIGLVTLSHRVERYLILERNCLDSNKPVNSVIGGDHYTGIYSQLSCSFEHIWLQDTKIIQKFPFVIVERSRDKLNQVYVFGKCQ